MSGNEAIALGAIEAGVKFCASYPGTPSTEITEYLMSRGNEYGIYSEWSTNEKVALEAATGASWAGIPSICPMKGLGMNVASDFLLNVNLSGIGKGGLVIVICDDPRGHSSSNEQDSRFYAKAARVPLLEPSTCQEAKDIMHLAFDVSKRYEVPVIVRSTTRLSHSRALVQTGALESKQVQTVEIFPRDLFNVPNPHLRHKELEAKLSDIKVEFESLGINSIERKPDSEILIISSGVAARYAEEALNIVGDDSIDAAKVVTSHPLPYNTLVKWLQNMKKVLFLEENDPFIEEGVTGLPGNIHNIGQIDFFGKRDGTVPFWGELNTDIAVSAIRHVLQIEKESVGKKKKAIEKGKSLLIPRPLTFCAGCTHRNVFWALRQIRKRLKGKMIVAGDIGCYSLGVFYDNAMTTMQAMGSGIGVASGLGQLGNFGLEHKVVAIAGDSTFFHACIPGLVNARHKNADVTFLILDNSTTAMTGFQTHPGSAIQNPKLSKVNMGKMVKAIDPEFIGTSDASDVPATIDLIHETIQKQGLKVLIFDSVCRLEENRRIANREDLPEVSIDDEFCKGEKCRICVGQFGCPAIGWNEESKTPVILSHQCVRCGACIDVCPYDAIRGDKS
ncbi:MAG: thiamine pyrophosphate-dependent enzyme [Candidatus Hodarchaeota archaeon]